jgi:predicted acyl esterase
MSNAPEVTARTEVRDGMRVTWHQPIPMSDGLVLRADVYRPIDDGRYPVILTRGIYAKGLAYQDGYPLQWQKMVADHPEILVGSTNAYPGVPRRPRISTSASSGRGTGGMTHNDPESRPADVFDGRVTLHAGGGRAAYLLLPIIPPVSGR